MTGLRGALAKTVRAAASPRARSATVIVAAVVIVKLGAAAPVETVAGTAVMIVARIAVAVMIVVAAVSAATSAVAAVRTAGHPVDARAPPPRRPTAGTMNRRPGRT